MGVDLACGERAFLDLTFAGLEAVPGPGEERRATALLRSPGGAAISAIGAARLGLRTALASPLGDDPEGDLLRGALAAGGVRWTGRRVARTPVTAVLPAGGERAMATFEPADAVTAEELSAVEPAAVVLSLPRVALAPPAAALYVTAGDDEARAGLAGVDLTDARALVVNAREALLLTGEDDPATAAQLLADVTPCAVVTLGAGGALAACRREVVRVAAVAVEAVDTTGAGDLFTAAYIWADRLGAPLEERVRWAVLHAALSVRVPTAVAGAVTEAALAEAGARQGLALPVPQPSAATKEEAR